MSNTEHIDPHACRQLWCAVFVQALRDSTGRGLCLPTENTRKLAIAQARNWPHSRDFDRVARWAGKEPSVARSQFLAAINDPELDSRLGGPGRRKPTTSRAGND